MSGYNEFSKSNNACEAEMLGRFPASIVARKLGVPTEFVRTFHTREWHHTSSRYNCTDYFDADAIREELETPEGLARLAEVKAELAAKAAQPVKVLEACTVKWLEWSGTRNHPHATEREANGCTVEDAGGKFVLVKFADGSTMKKGRATNGFEVARDRKRVWL